MIRIRRFDEVIGADRRCSNHTALSFGICTSTPLMTVGDTIGFFESNFRNIDENPKTEEGFGVNGMLLRKFVEEFPRGHFVVFTSGHAIAVHNGSVVDTAKKGPRAQKVRWAFQVLGEDRRLDRAFEDYRREYPENVFDDPAPRKPRKPKHRYSINIIILSIEDQIGRTLSLDEKENIENFLRERIDRYQLAKLDPVTNELLLSKKDAQELFVIAMKIFPNLR